MVTTTIYFCVSHSITMTTKTCPNKFSAEVFNARLQCCQKGWKKVANILLKVAQKLATLNNRFKTSLKLVLTGF